MRILFILLALVCSLSANAKKDEIVKVYLFGVATTFNDSIVIMTDINSIDSAYVKNGTLPERVIYSYQLEDYLETICKKPGATVAVIWGTDRKSVEKDFLKVRKRFLQDKTTKLEALPEEKFRFRRVDHIVTAPLQ
ncbi:MAG: hypothetical protein HUK00_09295 [Bacteroidaceae bacterium]|nr:hypothetical protein [Bacteroidaceae bacterium]